MRKLASIQKISAKTPINGADLIELVKINDWHIVVAKAEHYEVGDEVIYFEIDSFLPIREEFEFLRKNCYKKMSDESEGYRLRTIKLRGQFSQGLVLHKNKFPECENFVIGDDVTDILDVLKYEPPMPASLQGEAKGLFPSFIRKTDEERVQNLSEEYEDYKNHSFYVTEKIDGSSATFYFNNGEFGVCSRSLDLRETENNTFWKIARKFKIEEVLKSQNRNIAIQGELYGEGIQGNKYKKQGQSIAIFSLFDVDSYKYCSFSELKSFCSINNLPMVPILDENYQLPPSIESLLNYADGKSLFNQQTNREGVVLRSLDSSISFKAISNQFLLKYED